MTTLSRRQFLTAGGALVVSFALPVELRAQTSTPKDKLAQYGSVDSWLAVGADGRVTLLTGKVELGTGVETALSQLVAEELDVAVDKITVVQGDTERTPDQGYTVGSKTIHHGGPQIRQAAAEARQALLELAATRLGASIDRLTVSDSVVSVEGDPTKRATYAELVGGQRFNRALTGAAKPKRPEQYRVVGTSVRRLDIPGKVTGKHTYVQDIRRPGMLHGRVVRPDGVGASLGRMDERSVAAVPGLVRVVVKDNFVGVVAEREEQAIHAARTLKATWRPGPPLPEQKNLHADMRSGSTTDKVLVEVGDPAAALAGAARTIRATYQWPFQMHGSIGPSCAVADVSADRATVWCASQGVFGLRDALAKLLGLPPTSVHVLFAESAGCYGHNGVDDAAADAALLSQAVGRPVRVQWMRQDEHAWEPKGPAMEMSVRGGLDASGAVVAWDYEAWTPTHSTRPAAEPGNILAGHLTGLKPRSVFVGGDRNARHTYVFPNDRITMHWLAQSPLRVSALRGLGAPQNSFANESFMDELAAAAGADPLAFRLKHLKDPRAIAVLEAVAKLSNWQARPARNPAASSRLAPGHGIAYAQYENDTTYVAMVASVEVDRQSGGVRVKRVWVAHDCGLLVNPDGVRNQIEGNVVQTISRTLKEAVTFDRARVTSVDWQGYPLLRFTEVPEAVEITLINRPELPAVGAGEPAACPVPAVIANAVYDATGARLRAVPFTPERVKAALDTPPRT